ncbi:hypothetical protein ACJX0J_037259, partial [Zea mays]
RGLPHAHLLFGTLDLALIEKLTIELSEFIGGINAIVFNVNNKKVYQLNHVFIRKYSAIILLS